MTNYLLQHLISLEQINLLISCVLMGLIWVVQIVHYPSFLFIDAKNFIAFEKFHTARISYLVVPLMLAELALAFALLVISDFSAKYVSCSACVLLIWTFTFFLSVPCHQKLTEEGKNELVIRKLVTTNWLRTILWSIKVVVLWLL